MRDDSFSLNLDLLSRHEFNKCASRYNGNRRSPCFINVSAGSVHEVTVLDESNLEAGAYYIMDGGFVSQDVESRWQVELSFKWIKQYLRIKTFFGTSPNTVKTQIWTAITACVLVMIASSDSK